MPENNEPPTYDVELTVSELHAITKSLGISLSALANKLEHVTQGSRRHRDMVAEWRTLNDAQASVSDVLADAMEAAA